MQLLDLAVEFEAIPLLAAVQQVAVWQLRFCPAEAPRAEDLMARATTHRLFELQLAVRACGSLPCKHTPPVLNG